MKTISKKISLAASSKVALATKKDEMAQLHGRYLDAFARCPDDYETLKTEAVYLGGLSGHSFLLMAQRLKKIKDLQLYKQQDYTSFAEFVDAEMSLNRATVYDYMGILEAFGHEPLLAQPNLQYSKLRPAVPLLTAKNDAIPKDQIRTQFIAQAKTDTRQQIVETANKLKAKYGLAAPPNATQSTAPLKPASSLQDNIDAFLASIPKGKLDKQQKQQLRQLVNKLAKIIVIQ